MTRARACSGARGFAVVLFVWWPLAVGWLNPYRDEIAEANRLLKSGKYQEAIQKYGQELVDQPEAPLLNYNMGNANYKAGKFSEALSSYARVRTGDDDPKRTARTAYNAGNAQYRLAATLEKDKPQEAIQGYALALAAYRRALGVDPSDQDAKFNYELATKRIEEIQKRLQEEKDKQKQKDEEKQQQEEQQQQDQQQQDESQQKQGQEPPQDQQQGQQEQEEQNQSREGEQPQQAEEEQQQGDSQPQQAEDDQAPEQDQSAASQEAAQDESSPPEQSDAAQAGASAAGEESGDPSKREAAALLDSAKNEELTPQEFSRRVQGGAVAEPAQDW